MNVQNLFEAERLLPVEGVDAERDPLDWADCAVAMSVVVPASGRVDLMRETMASLAEQTFRDFEVVVTDDSPDEGDRAAIRRLASDFADATDLVTRYVFTRPRLYQAPNTNQGLRHARGNLIRILHNDDLLRRDAIATEVAAFADQPWLEVLFEDRIAFVDKIDWSGDTHQTLVSPAHHLRTQLSHCTAVPSGLVFSSAAMRDVGLMDERMRFLCDWDFFCRLMVRQIEKRNLVARVSPGLVGWRTHANSITNRLWREHFYEHEMFIRELMESERVERLGVFTEHEKSAFLEAANRYRYSRLRHDYKQLPPREQWRHAAWYARHGTRSGGVATKVGREARRAIAKVKRRFRKASLPPAPGPQETPPATTDAAREHGSLAIAPYYHQNILDSHDENLVVDFDNTLNLWPLRDALGATRRVRLYYVNINRMYERTLNEVLKYVGVGHEVELVMTGNHHLQWFGLKAAVSHLFPGQFQLVHQEKNEHDEWRLRYRRNTPAPAQYTAPHTGWTFGLLTLGDKPQRALAYVDSIERACREPYEVLVVCPEHLPFLADRPHVRQIHFSEQDDKGWITKKKNLVCDAAQHSDILVCHDRFTLPPDFCEAFDAWGYAYGMAAPRLRLPDGRRAVDWAVVSSQNRTWSHGGLLDYRSYSPYAYVPGGATLVRKEFWRRFPWDENLFWNEHEDVELCRRAQRHGEVLHLSGATLVAEADRWVDQNPPIPFCSETEILHGGPVGEQRLHFMG